MNLIPDTLDFRSYLMTTEAAVKVRPASAFAADLVAEFAPRNASEGACMRSTKLRLLEFRPAEVTCWSGYNGHRKSMFTGQVALDLMRSGHRTLLASFEMSPARTLARMARQACASHAPDASALARFSAFSDARLWIFDHLGRIDPATCLAVCRYFAQELQGQQVFIDSMMMVCGSEESLDEQKQFMTDLVRLAQETQLHVHLITHCRKPQQGEDRPPTKYDLRGSAAISDQAHNVITVWANKAKAAKLQQDPTDAVALAEPDARVGVEKQRNGEFEGALRLWWHPPSMRFMDDRLSPVEPCL